MKKINIETEVKKEVFTRFANEKFNEGREVLKRLAFYINENSTTEEKRLVFYNLAWVNEYKKDFNIAKFHIKNIKNIVEQDQEYMEKNKSKYLDILSLYRDLFQDEICVEEQIGMEIVRKGFYEENQDILRMLVCDFNIAKLEQDIEMMMWSIESIHMYYVNNKNKEDDKNEKEKWNTVINQLKTELIDIDANAYQELMDAIEDNLASISPEARTEGVY